MYSVNYHPAELVKPLRLSAIAYTVVAALWMAIIGIVFREMLAVDSNPPLYLTILAGVSAAFWIGLVAWSWYVQHAASRATVALELDSEGLTSHSPGSAPRRIPWAGSRVSWGSWLGKPVLRYGGPVAGRMVGTRMLATSPAELHAAIAQFRGAPPEGQVPGPPSPQQTLR